MCCRITDANAAHLPAMEHLEQLCFSLPWTREQLEASLRDAQHVFLAAEDEQGKLLGYAGMMHVLDEGYVENVAVDPACRCRGIGRALIKALFARAEALGLSFVTLELRESNAAAEALYTAQGFVPVGRRKGYYEAPREDAILMTKFLK